MSADGASASLTIAFFSDFATNFFGCSLSDCGNGEVGHNFDIDDNTIFADQASAQASVKVTAVAPVQLPAGGLLLLSGLVGAAALKRRKKVVAA